MTEEKPCIKLEFEIDPNHPERVDISVIQTKGCPNENVQQWVDNTAAILNKHLDLFLPDVGCVNLIIKVERSGTGFKFDYNMNGMTMHDIPLNKIAEQYIHFIKSETQHFVPKKG